MKKQKQKGLMKNFLIKYFDVFLSIKQKQSNKANKVKKKKQNRKNKKQGRKKEKNKEKN